MTPEKLVSQLRDALGTDLRAVILYGSAVAGERIGRASDVNLLVIAEALHLRSLRGAGGALQEWVAGGNSPPLLFTVEEWQRSADAFPMEYSDILEYHQVLYGEPPFAGIEIDRAHLRLQVEQDARGKLLHLRRALVAAGTNAAAQLQILEHTLSKLMVLYRAVLRLEGAPHPKDYEQLTLEAAQAAGFDPELVLPVVRHVRGSENLSEADAAGAAEAYLDALEQLVRHLDELD